MLVSHIINKKEVACDRVANKQRIKVITTATLKDTTCKPDNVIKIPFATPLVSHNDFGFYEHYFISDTVH